LGSGDYGVFGIVNGKLLMGQRREVLLNFGANDANGMVRTGVQSFTNQSGNVGRDIVVGMV
jgi:hypothetical protein